VAQVADEMLLASGQGADELFGGYARYERMTSMERRSAMRHDVTKLLIHGSRTEHVLAAYFDKEVRHPFLDPEVVELALQLPDELLIDGGIRKVALRQIARAIDLVEEADRKKKAAQYGSGVMRTMKAMAKRDGLTVGQWSRSLAQDKVMSKEDRR
jgi:asparagine synthase (glutamine-hydrolysing)